jgi:glutaminyl-tRNA synthetase
MCTTEFKMSRVSYDWLLEQLDMKKPHSDEIGPMQREYGRLNVNGTILSKRRIQILVNGTTVEKKLPDGTVDTQKIPPSVRGWDDPRLYTLVALRRRGIPAQALLNFVDELGVTDALTEIQTVRLDGSIRKYLERTVPRLMLVLNPIKMVIEDLTDGDEQTFTIPYDPKGQIVGSRTVPFSKEIYIDASDFREEDDPNFFRLAPNKSVGLLNVPFPILAKSFTKDQTGQVTEIRAVKTEGKPKAFIHWVDAATGINVIARQYNPLFKSESPNALDWKNGGWVEDLNPNSEVVHEHAIIERGINDLIKEHATHPNSSASDDLVRFQALRTAYFCIDPEKNGDTIVLNQIVTLREDKGK